MLFGVTHGGGQDSRFNSRQLDRNGTCLQPQTPRGIFHGFPYPGHYRRFEGHCQYQTSALSLCERGWFWSVYQASPATYLPQTSFARLSSRRVHFFEFPMLNPHVSAGPDPNCPPYYCLILLVRALEGGSASISLTGDAWTGDTVEESFVS